MNPEYAGRNTLRMQEIAQDDLMNNLTTRPFPES